MSVSISVPGSANSGLVVANLAALPSPTLHKTGTVAVVLDNGSGQPTERVATGPLGGSGTSWSPNSAGTTSTTPGSNETVVLLNGNGSTTHIAQRRLIDQLTVATGYTWHDLAGTQIPEPTSAGSYVPGNTLRVARADFDAANSATTFLSTWAVPVATDIVVFDPDGNEDIYNISDAAGGLTQWHQVT